MSHSNFQVKITTSNSNKESSHLGEAVIANIFPTEIPRRFIDIILVQTVTGEITEYTSFNKSISIPNIGESMKEILEDFRIKDEVIETITVVMNIDKISDYLKYKSSSILDNHFTT